MRAMAVVAPQFGPVSLQKMACPKATEALTPQLTVPNPPSPLYVMLCFIYLVWTLQKTLDEPDALIKVSIAQVLVFITCP